MSDARFNFRLLSQLSSPSPRPPPAHLRTRHDVAAAFRPWWFPARRRRRRSLYKIKPIYSRPVLPGDRNRCGSITRASPTRQIDRVNVEEITFFRFGPIISLVVNRGGGAEETAPSLFFSFSHRRGRDACVSPLVFEFRSFREHDAFVI